MQIYLQSSPIILPNSPIVHCLIFTVHTDSFLLSLSAGSPTHNPQLAFHYQTQLYHCTFSRNVHLNYAAKLDTLTTLIGTNCMHPVPNHWLMLYEIHDFKAKNTHHGLKVGLPAYGEPVVRERRGRQGDKTIVSNCFRHRQETFFFLEQNQNHPNTPDEGISTVLSEDRTTLYGLSFHNIFAPFKIVLSEKEVELNIHPSIRDSLERTCQLSYKGSFCTGIFFSPKIIISAKHLLPEEDQKRGTGLMVRRFPYTMPERGVVVKVGDTNVDFMEVEVGQEEQKKDEIQNGKYEKESHRNKNPVTSLELLSKLKQFPSGITFNSAPRIGIEIYAIGFGKYSYHYFSDCELLLPTIHRGCLSKTISLNGRLFFLKTDINLSHGFSGCGIWDWKEQNSKKQHLKDSQAKYKSTKNPQKQSPTHSLLGMALFVITNKQEGQLKVHHHNFSYSIELIDSLMKEQQLRSAGDWMADFNQIHARKRILPKF